MLHESFVVKAYILNFRPLVPFLHVKKFVVGGGWVLKWILVLSLDPSLTIISVRIDKTKILVRMPLEISQLLPPFLIFFLISHVHSLFLGILQKYIN